MLARLLTVLALFISGASPVIAEDTLPPQSFSLCAGCHTTAANNQHRNAPPLSGIVGKRIASVPGFNYSDALKAEGGIWTRAKLDSFLQRPTHALPGTKMYFRGLNDPDARAELINWLATATVPSVLKPHSEKRLVNAKQTTKQAQQLFRPCTRCHSYTKGAPAKIGPNLFGIVGRPVASFPGFDYTQRIKQRGGTWNASRLHVFFTEKKSFGQGSHLAFRALKLKQDRDMLIEFLKGLSDKAPISSPTSETIRATP